MRLFKRYDPHIIDLVQYEKDLLYQREHGIRLKPVSPIPSLLEGYWSVAELAAMRENREKAREIYERIA